MTKICTVCLTGLLALGASLGPLPSQAAWGSVLASDAPALELLSDDQLGAVTGGKSKNTTRCLATLGSLSVGLKFGGAWFTAINPVGGLAIMGLGVATQVAMVLC